MTRRVKQRERLLTLLREAADPLDAHRLADTLGLHVTTVRFHLTRLAEEGLVRSVTLPTDGVGRPRLGYAATKEPSYTDLVALLAARLGGDADERERTAFDVGDDWAGLLGLRPAATADAGTLVIDALERLGFEIGTATNAFGTHTLTLCTCPLAGIARTHPEVVRGIQRGLVQRVLDDHATVLGRRYVVEVHPDPQGGNCLLRLVLRPGPGDPAPTRHPQTTSARNDGRVAAGRAGTSERGSSRTEVHRTGMVFISGRTVRS